jgi:hypothetical protein
MAHALSPTAIERTLASCHALCLSNAVCFARDTVGDAQISNKLLNNNSRSTPTKNVEFRQFQMPPYLLADCRSCNLVHENIISILFFSFFTLIRIFHLI